MKELGKSVNIWRSYGYKYSVLFFDSQCRTKIPKNARYRFAYSHWIGIHRTLRNISHCFNWHSVSRVPRRQLCFLLCNAASLWEIEWRSIAFADENSLLEALPKKMKTDLAIHVHFNTLTKVNLFQASWTFRVSLIRMYALSHILGDKLWLVFTARCYASAVLAMAPCLSVCLSVRLSVRHKSEFGKTAKCRIT